MNIHSELIKSIEQGNSLEATAVNLKSKLIHLIKTTKQEINLLKQQEILLHTASQNFPDRRDFLKHFESKDMGELRPYSRLHTLLIPVAEGMSTILKGKEKWYNFSQRLKVPVIPYLMNIDHNALSAQTLQEIGLIVNANRNNINQMWGLSLAARGLFGWLATTYDWSITIRDRFPQFSNFKEVDKLVEKDFLEYSSLCTVVNSIQNKEKELDLLENYELPRINKLLGL